MCWLKAAALHLARVVRPAAILLGLVLPGLNGAEVGPRAGAGPAGAGIPMILLSARLSARRQDPRADRRPPAQALRDRRPARPRGAAGVAGLREGEEHPMQPMQPEAVQQLLRGEVGEEALQRLLAALRADPDWQVLPPLPGEPEWLFQLVYRPTGRPYGFPARRLGAHAWRFAAQVPGWLGAGYGVTIGAEGAGQHRRPMPVREWTPGRAAAVALDKRVPCWVTR